MADGTTARRREETLSQPKAMTLSTIPVCQDDSCDKIARLLLLHLSLKFTTETMTKVTNESALETIFAARNNQRKIWTPTILLDRMGLSRSPIPYSNYDTQSRRQAKRVLHELWLQGNLLRKTKPDTRNRYLAGSEIAYVRPADAPNEFLVPCRTCRKPCLSHGDQDLLCEQCTVR